MTVSLEPAIFHSAKLLYIYGEPVNYIALLRVFLLAFILRSTCAAAQQRFQFTEQKMGSPLHLIFYTSDSIRAAKLANASFALVDSLNAVFSDYLETSELNRLCKTAGSNTFVPVSPQLYQILSLSKTAAKKTDGAYDITIGPLSRLWRSARRSKRFPAEEEVQQAKENTGMQNLVFDPIRQAVKLLQPGMQLDLGGIAKGHVAQQVVNFLRANGVQSALADAGGDLACSDAPPGKTGWTIGVNVPEQEDLLAETLTLSNSAVATSGDVYQYIEHEGKRYSHIIDPRTGYGVQFQRNVTVLAPDGATADWLATACSILPLKKCKRLVGKFGADLLITQLEGNKIRYFMTKGMKARLKK